MSSANLFYERDQYAIVRFLHLQKMESSDIHKVLQGVMGEGTPSYKVIKEWLQDIVDGRDFKNDSCTCSSGNIVAGAPFTPTDPALVARIEFLLGIDGRLSVDQLAEMTTVSKHTVMLVLTNVLGLRRVHLRWVSRLLTLEQRQYRLSISRELYERYESAGSEFLSSIIIGDENFVHYYFREGRRHSHEGRRHSVGCSDRYRPHNEPGEGRFMYFFDIQGLLLYYPIPDHMEVTAEYYAEVLNNELIPAVRRKRIRQNFFFLQDNDAVHNSRLVMTTLQDNNMEPLLQPPGSPDLNPCDYWLFPHLHEQLKGTHFKDRSALLSGVMHHTKAIQDMEYGSAIRKLPDRWMRCIEGNGVHVV